MKQPSIYIAGIQIDEPVTSITAVLVSAVCFYAFSKLNQVEQKSKVHFYIKMYFLSMSVATLVGGIIGHAFLYALSFEWKLLGWLTSMFSIMLLERASIEYMAPIIPNKLKTTFKWVNIIELCVFIVITFVTLNFFFVELHSAYGLLVVVTSLNSYVYYKRKTKGSKLFLIAVGHSAIAALIYMNEWSISIWFTHSDISHIFMTVSAWYFYLGSRHILKDPELATK